MKYKVGDKIIFDKDYESSFENYSTKEAAGWVESWLIGKVATITKIERANIGNFCWYYIDIPNTHGYDEALFSPCTVNYLVEV